jgi:hypothetical protein
MEYEMEQGVPGHPVFDIELKDGRRIKIYANSMVEGLEGEIASIGNRIPGLIGLRDNLFNYFSIPFKLP